MRRRSFVGAIAAASIGFAGCTGNGDDTGGDDSGGDDTGGDDSGGGDTGSDLDRDGGDSTEVTWVMSSGPGTVDIEVQYQPVFDRLEEEFDIEIDVLETRVLPETVEELERADDGEAVMADTASQAVPQLGPEQIDVVGTRKAFGSDRYFGTLVTRADTDIAEVSDLKGETVAMGDVRSVSGGTAPMWMLHNHGLDIGNAPEGGSAEDFEWRSGVVHELAVEELIQDETVVAAGAGEFATVPHVPLDQIEGEYPDLTEYSPEIEYAGTRDPELRLLDVSPPIPRAPIVVNAAWEDDLRFDIEEFVRDLDTEEFEHDAFDLAAELDLDLPQGLLEDYNDDGVSAAPREYDLDEGQEADWLKFNDHTLWFSGITEADHETFDPIDDFATDLGLGLDEF